MTSKPIQIVSYISRNPNLTPEQFYKHWSTVHAPIVAPWVEKHGITSYKQIHTSGTIVPNKWADFRPGALSWDLPTTPVPYDGIVVWETPTLEAFQNMFQDPYFSQVVEPDEHNLLDKKGVGNGVIAGFNGPTFSVVKDGKSFLGPEADEYRRKWEEFEKENDK